MRTTTCVSCKKESPRNSSIVVGGNDYCEICHNLRFALHDEFVSALSGKKFEYHGQTVAFIPDPTVCQRCNTDFGETELPLHYGLLVCEPCKTALESRKTPIGIWIFFIGILALVISSAVVNWKYYNADRLITQSIENLVSGNFEPAYKDIRVAKMYVEDNAEVDILYNYTKGLYLISQDSSADALPYLEKCRNLIPPEFELEAWIIQAKIGIAFDSANYEEYVTQALLYTQMFPEDPTAWASLASAYACLYTQTDNSAQMELAYQSLKKSQALADPDNSEIQLYYNRINHRLQTKRIISHEEFLKEFPNGWTPN